MEQSDHAGSGSPAPQVGADDGEPTAHHGAHQSSTPDGASKGLNPRQLVVLEQLLAGASVTKAAEAAGVDRTTVHRWLREDWAFQAAHHRAQRDLRRAVEARLPHLVEAAVETVQAAVRDGDVRAALAVLKGLGALPGSAPRIGTEDAAELAEDDRLARASAPRTGTCGDCWPGRPTLSSRTRVRGWLDGSLEVRRSTPRSRTCRRPAYWGEGAPSALV